MQRTSSPTLTNTTQPNPGVGGDAPIVYPTPHPSLFRLFSFALSSFMASRC